MAQVMQQVPGTKGNIAAPKQRSLWARAMVGMGLMKRAKNVNEDFVSATSQETQRLRWQLTHCSQPYKVAIPAGTTCTGTMGGQTGVCLVKIANSNKAGPFGGVVPFQIAGAGAGAGTGATNTTGATTAAKRSSVDPDDFEIPDEPDN
jgi:hypothetical protein